MILTYKELKNQMGSKRIEKLFKGGNLSNGVTYKIGKFIVEYSAVSGKFYLGWSNR